jgi:hypothetical protein
MAYVLMALMMVLLGGCGGSSGSGDGSGTSVYAVANGYTGTLEQSDAFMTLLVSETTVNAYVCNGEETIQQWFEGNVSDPLHFTLGNENAETLHAVYGKGHYEGNVTSNGRIYRFSLYLNGNERSGIYKVIDVNATNDGIAAGWIVDEVNDTRGAMTIYGSFVTAPPLSQGNLVYQSKTYRVFRIQLAGSDGNKLPVVISSEPPSPPPPGVPVPYPNIGTTATK